MSVWEEYGPNPSQAEMSRAKIAKQRRDQRLQRMSSSRNLAQAQSGPEPSPGTNQMVSKLVSRFETVPSPIKMPRPPPTSAIMCRIPNAGPVSNKNVIQNQPSKTKSEANPVPVQGQDVSLQAIKQ